MGGRTLGESSFQHNGPVFGNSLPLCPPFLFTLFCIVACYDILKSIVVGHSVILSNDCMYRIVLWFLEIQHCWPFCNIVYRIACIALYRTVCYIVCIVSNYDIRTFISIGRFVILATVYCIILWHLKIHQWLSFCNTVHFIILYCIVLRYLKCISISHYVILSAVMHAVYYIVVLGHLKIILFTVLHCMVLSLRYRQYTCAVE